MLNCENLLASLAQLDMSTLMFSASVAATPATPTGDTCRRKRRRGEVANPSNTLDALVAKKADEQPFEKRYLSEHEAIEGPDDEIEMKRMELDPDVSTRTCSTCGYQGKWVSEMIRHKRVHTSERPFKCRYCSRTSKWKADLIRHVAKTHGIRVVSKYSRSKVFDGCGVTPLSSPTESISEKPSPRQQCVYRCQLCSFEDERISVLTQHIGTIHATSPCVCRCGARFDDIQHALNHPTGGAATNCEMMFNIVPTYEKPSPLSPCHSEVSLDSGINVMMSETEEEGVANVANVVAAATPVAPALPLLQSPLFSLYLALLQSTVPPTSTVICSSTSSSEENIVVDV